MLGQSGKIGAYLAERAQQFTLDASTEAALQRNHPSAQAHWDDRCCDIVTTLGALHHETVSNE